MQLLCKLSRNSVYPQYSYYNTDSSSITNCILVGALRTFLQNFSRLISVPSYQGVSTPPKVKEDIQVYCVSLTWCLLFLYGYNLTDRC